MNNAEFTVYADAIAGGLTTEVEWTSDDANCAWEPFNDFTITKACPEEDLTGARVGDPITYEVTITNIGDLPIEILGYIESRDGDFDVDPVGIILQPQGDAEGDDEVVLTFTSEITSEDALLGNVDNAISVNTDAGAKTADTGDCTFDAVQDLLLDKTCPETDGLRVDDEITYLVTITNTGDVTWTNVVVTDTRDGEFDEAFPTSFAPGQTETRTFTSTVTAEDALAGNVDNTVRVTAERMSPEDNGLIMAVTVVEIDDEGNLEAEFTAECPFVPTEGLLLEKSATHTDDKVVDEGTVITYTFDVTNTGDTPLEDVTVNDPLPNLTWDEANADGLVGDLAPGETKAITATYVVTAEDLEAGTVHNCAVAVSGEVESNEDCVDVPVTAKRGLELLKTGATADGKDARKGTVITYTFAVTNTGNVALEDVVVVDPLPGLTWSADNADGAVGDLEPGETKTITATYVVTGADVKAGKVHNCAMATDGETDSNESCVTIPVKKPAPKPIMLPDTGSGDTAGKGMTWTLALMAATLMAATAAGIRRREAQR